MKRKFTTAMCVFRLFTDVFELNAILRNVVKCDFFPDFQTLCALLDQYFLNAITVKNTEFVRGLYDIPGNSRQQGGGETNSQLFGASRTRKVIRRQRSYSGQQH